MTPLIRRLTTLVLLFAVPASAQTADSLQAFLDREVPRLLQKHSVPGAALAVVRRSAGPKLLAYGVANATQNTPVDSSTPFRIASVSKVFTALAALHSVAAGKIGLGDDLRPLLERHEIAHGFQEPLTLHQLLTHTAGFEEQLTGYLAPPGVPVEDLRGYLTQALPARAAEPSQLPSYSNHGYALAGLVAELVEGRPFHELVRDLVIRPTGMNSTWFALMPADSARLATEYRASGEVRLPRASRPYPAGNIATTAHDMALLMHRILSASDTARGDRPYRMLLTPAITVPPLPPISYGLTQLPIRGRLVWIKGGASPSHSAALVLSPENGAGAFIVVNRQEPLFWEELLPGLVEQLGPAPAPRAADTATAGRTVPLSGKVSYGLTQAPSASYEKVLGLAMQFVVEPAGGDSVLVKGPELNGILRREASGAFAGPRGKLFIGPFGSAEGAAAVVQGQVMGLRRLHWHESARFQLGVLAAATVVTLAAGVPAVTDRASSAGARAATIGLPIINLAALGSAVVLAGQGDQLVQGPTRALGVTLGLTTATGVAAAAQTVGAAWLAARSPAGPVRRSLYGAGAVGGAGLGWFLVTNNLVRIWPW